MKCPNCDSQFTRKQINSFFREEKERLKSEFETAHAGDLKRIRKMEKFFSTSFLALLIIFALGIFSVLTSIVFFNFDPSGLWLRLAFFGVFLTILCMYLEAYWGIKEFFLFRQYKEQHQSE